MSPTPFRLREMGCFLFALVVLASLYPYSSACPSHCAICLNAIYVCNKWQASYDLSNHNDIGTINSNAFINAGQMITLDISTNLIDTIETNAFAGLTNLQNLHLSSNRIATLPDNIFQPLVNLRTLDLRSNLISHLNPQAFAGLTNVTKLYLNNNQLVSLTSEEITQLLNNLPSLQNITLANNRWYCDCNITALQDLLLTSSKVDDKANVRCYAPPELSNTAIASLDFFVEPACFSMSPSPSPSPLLSPSSSLFSPSPSPLFSPSPSPLFSSSPSPLFSPSPSPLFSPSPSPLLSSSLSPSISLSPSQFFSPSPSQLPSSSLSDPSPSPSLTTFYSPSPSLLQLPSSTLSSAPQSTVIFTSSSLYITPFSSPMPSPSPSSFFSSSTSILLLSSSSFVSPPFLISPSPSTTSLPRPTPTPYCLRSTTESDIGVIHWTRTLASLSNSVDCPYGPAGSFAIRLCILSPSNEALWGAVSDEACFTAHNRLQQLLLQEITDDNAVAISEEVADLPFAHLSAEGLSLFVDIVSKLIAFGRTSITVVVNVLSGIDLLLASDRAQTLSDTDAESLQSVISTALLSIVNTNNTQQIFQFSRLFIGAKYATTNNVTVEVNLQDEGRLLFTPAGRNASGDIVVEIYSNELGGHTLQVTIFNDSTLFHSRCLTTRNSSEPICDVQVISPIAVTSVSEPLAGQYVNVTFENILADPSYTLYCALWNTNNSDSGQWDATQCNTHTESRTSTAVICSCSNTGSMAIIAVLPDNFTTGNPPHPLPLYRIYARLLFYIASGLGVLLHVPVMVAAMRISYKQDYVRNIQALLHHCITQMLMFVAMMASFQRTEIKPLCLALGSLLHYLILVTYIWLTFRIIILCMSQVRRRPLYEKDCFILPFFFITWSLPIVPVVIYGVLAFMNNEAVKDLDNCWIESFVFPSYFMYLCLVSTVLLITVASIIALIMACSGYIVTPASYYQLFGMFLEAVFFSGTIALHFVTAAHPSELLLILLSGMILLCSAYFFVANGLMRNTIRRSIFCQKDRSTFYGNPHSDQVTPSTASSISQISNRNRETRRVHVTRPTDAMNLDYIGGYLGFPIEMWTEVEDGRRVVKKKGFLSNGFTRGSSDV